MRSTLFSPVNHVVKLLPTSSPGSSRFRHIGKREDPGDENSEDAIILVSTKDNGRYFMYGDIYCTAFTYQNNKDGGQSIAQSMLFGWLLSSFKTRFIIVSTSDDKYITEA